MTNSHFAGTDNITDTETDNITIDIGTGFDRSRRSYRKIMRDLLVQIIEKQDFPVAARVFSMACFTFELDSFVQRMVIDTALFRFFLITSPAMDKIDPENANACEADSRMIAEDIADTIVREEKAVPDLQKTLIEQQMQSLAETTPLIRI